MSQIIWKNGKRKYLSRHIMERKLGRPLEDFEYVYFKNHNPDDCSEENLELVTRNECMRRIRAWISERIHTKMLETFTHMQEVYEACGLEFTMDDYLRHHHGDSKSRYHE